MTAEERESAVFFGLNTIQDNSVTGKLKKRVCMLLRIADVIRGSFHLFAQSISYLSNDNTTATMSATNRYPLRVRHNSQTFMVGSTSWGR